MTREPRAGCSPAGNPAGRSAPTGSANGCTKLGLRPGQDCSTTLFGLAAELPAALLARLPGINISVAVTWQRASAGDWTTYAASYSRRGNPANVAGPAPDDLSWELFREFQYPTPPEEADMALKQRALDRTTPPASIPGRYKPGDQLLAFLEAL